MEEYCSRPDETIIKLTMEGNYGVAEEWGQDNKRSALKATTDYYQRHTRDDDNGSGGQSVVEIKGCRKATEETFRT